MRKAKVVFLSLVVVLLLFPSTWLGGVSHAAETDDGLVLRVENQQIRDGSYTNLNDKVNDLKGLQEGTIIVRFRYNAGNVMSLFSLSNRTLPNDHFHLYVTSSAIGIENRNQDNNNPGSNIHVKKDIAIKANEVHTVAMVVDKKEGYKYFLDGELVLRDTTSDRQFMNRVYAPDSAQLGRTERPAGSNTYNLNGDIDFAEVYSKPLADSALASITGVTKAVPVTNPKPDNAEITDPQNIFYSGFMSSNNYRIPALLYTKAGTLIAGIDRRVPNGSDSPNNIDAMVRRSMDQGATWESSGIIINDYPDQASNIDQSLMQDEETGRIFSLVDGFPNGGGLLGGFGNNAYKGTGFRTVDGKKYMYLTDAGGKEYTIRDEGKVYDSAGALTDYTVDAKRNLFKNGVKVSNVFAANSPLKAFKTQYLELYYSDDEGATWTGPVDLNPVVKEEWMIFLGTGPGTGIQLKEGEHKGRLVFPVYFLNDYNKQASAVIYSDDHGKTWHRGESPNEGRDVGGGTIIHEKDFTNSSYELTESQVVEMPDGQLKLFIRNYSGYAQIATSFDGGETWDATVVTEKDLIAAYCQMTAIRYNGKIDGKEAVIFGAPANSSSRVSGTVKVGLIEEDGKYPNGRTKYKFNWKYAQKITDGHYAYSSLANLGGGKIGLLYEGTDNTNMSFIKFNAEYLKWQREGQKPEPKLKSIALESAAGSGYESGERVRIKAVFDGYVMLSGDRKLTGTIGDRPLEFDLVQQNAAGTEFVFEAEFPDLPKGKYSLDAVFSDGLSIRSVYGVPLAADNENHKLHAEINSGTVGEGSGEETYVVSPDRVSSGGSFQVQIGVRRLTTSVFAQDITVLYDASLMEFISASPLLDGVKLIEAKTDQPGKIRLIVASEGAGHGVTGDQKVAEVAFKAKDVGETKSGAVQTANAWLADADGKETEAGPASARIEIYAGSTGEPGDLNGDGKVSIGDLAILAAQYGKDASSPNWNEIKHLDLDGSGSIDIADLAIVAQKIIR
ncbi:sialidase domain-containing protein [Paenibacillus sp. SAF-054]|uniref:sialidase domain-containing protein n=1 Tax=unclassified Paenibacillus TaxID=185978 RepID=UPI003F7F456E